MTKWICYGALTVALIWGWSAFMGQGEDEIEEINEEITRIENEGSQEDLSSIHKLEQKKENITGRKTFTGILLAFATAILVGIIFVVDFLPQITDRFTHAMYDSGEVIEADALHDARAKVAQGDYEGAIVAFRKAAEKDPENRMPWMEIAKIQHQQFEDPHAAAATLREAIEAQEWTVDDAAFLMFRLAEIYDEAIGDRSTAASILHQAIEQFPETRHSANARHKLQEWGMV